jgi:hypothetical protein
VAAIAERIGVLLIEDDRLAQSLEIPALTVDEVIESCVESRGDDWAFWVYFCEDTGAHDLDLGSCAQAVYLKQRGIGLAWSPLSEDETAALPAPASLFAGRGCLYHWIELLYEGVVVERHLAAWIDGASASLPAPSAEPRGHGLEPTLWVSARAHRLVRLANEVDPECSGFDDCFAGSGIELR